ncbi:unnamed protein product [Durusdinium trenchii]|uniref:PABS domain-containing protein n=1 Tax=Durusdinium trenchii TaxID=1381693 RepID=A0ABP0PUA3_9DINO
MSTKKRKTLDDAHGSGFSSSPGEDAAASEIEVASDEELEAFSPVVVEEVLHEEKTEYQTLMIFRSKSYGLCLSLDGVLQSTERDEAIYHEYLVHVPLLLCDTPIVRVLICGGGNGAAAREVLKHGSVQEIVLIDIDPAVCRAARRFLLPQAFALSDARVKTIFADASDFQNWPPGSFDVIVVDSTDFGSTAGRSNSLWSKQFFEGCWKRLAPTGHLSTQLGACRASPGGLCWSAAVDTVATLRAAGLAHVEVYAAEIASYGGLALFGVAGAQGSVLAPAGAVENTRQLEQIDWSGRASLRQLSGCKELDLAKGLSASFQLPAPLAKALQDARVMKNEVMTRDCSSLDPPKETNQTAEMAREGRPPRSEAMNKFTWASRGWCLAESMACELCSSNPRAVVLVESAVHLTVAPGHQQVVLRPGEGSFSMAADRSAVAEVLQSLIKRKLKLYLEEGQIHRYRFLWSQQRVRLSGFSLAPVEDIVPGGPTEAEALSKFLYQNGFARLGERDAAGWSPLCYAALGGNPVLIREMLQERADPNDRITKPAHFAIMPKNTPVLHVVSFLHHQEALELLLEFRANVNAKDALGHIALHTASASNNAQGLRTLLHARAMGAQGPAGMTPLMVASVEGSIDAVKTLVPLCSPADLSSALLMSSCFCGSSELILTLMEQRADLNVQLKPTWTMWLVFKLSRLHHHRHPSRLSLMVPDVSGASPLMCSILSGHFEAAQTLVTCGASVQLRNARGKNAQQLAEEVFAPPCLLEAIGLAQESNSNSLALGRYLFEASQPSFSQQL